MRLDDDTNLGLWKSRVARRLTGKSGPTILGSEEAPHVEVVNAARAMHEMLRGALAERDADQPFGQAEMSRVTALEGRHVVERGRS